MQRIETQLASLDEATKDIVELVDREIAHASIERSKW
jgi:hypothetical protein